MRRTPVIAAAILAVTLGVITAPPAHATLTCATAGFYMIDTEADLRALATTPACHATGFTFTQTNDITLTSAWTPIGTLASKFQGTYDGNGKRITGVSMAFTSTSAVEDYGGLFGYSLNATLKNIILDSVSISNGDRTISGPQYVGGIVGRADNTDILNSTVSGTIDATNFVGGIAGRIENGSLIRDSSSSGSVGSDWTITGAGGIVGDARNSDLLRVTSSSTIVVRPSADSPSGTGAGGLVGDGRNVNITDGNASGSVTGFQRLGGLIGSFQLAYPYLGASYNILNSRASGDVIGLEASTNSLYLGGLIGSMSADPGSDSPSTRLRVMNSQATGSAVGNQRIGGLIGSLSMMINRGAGVNVDIDGSSASGAVTGRTQVGGLLGYSSFYTMGAGSSLTISLSNASGNTTGNEAVGGLIGRMESGGLVEESYATGTVQGGATGAGDGLRAGGLIGSMVDSVTVVRSYATGSVSGLARVGGLVGELDGPSSGTSLGITDSFSTGSAFARGLVSGAARDAYVGGITGRNQDAVTVTSSYATGSVSATAGSSYLGGVTGSDSVSMTATALHWNAQTTGINYAAGTSDDAGASITGASALSTSQMQSSTSFPGWDFTTVWGYQCSTSIYPQLRAINAGATATTCIEPAPTPDPGGGGTPTADPTPTPVTAPTTPSETAPATPPASLPPGSVFGTIGGSPIDIQTQPGARGTGLTLQAGPVEISLRGTTSNGQRIPLAANGSLILPRSGQIPTGASGLAPGTSITQVLYSTPVELGTASANSSGTFTSSPTLPATVPTGAHTLSITGTTNTGLPFTIALGVTVATPAVALGANPVVTVKPRKVSSDMSVNVMARAVQAGCLVTFVAGDTRTTTQASASGVAQVTIPVHKVRARSWEITTRVTGKGCATITVKTKVPVTRPAN